MATPQLNPIEALEVLYTEQPGACDGDYACLGNAVYLCRACFKWVCAAHLDDLTGLCCDCVPLDDEGWQREVQRVQGLD